MQKELITEKHEKWLKDHYGITFDDVENMNDEEWDAFTTNLADDEADAIDTDDEMLVVEVVDIVCGPYGTSELESHRKEDGSWE